uniref:Uncharacterized protein n=1 Tax=Arundo donax TaxID=35708 RepID=A0A0A9DG82_ARUDO
MRIISVMNTNHTKRIREIVECGKISREYFIEYRVKATFMYMAYFTIIHGSKIQSHCPSLIKLAICVTYHE